MDWSLDPNSALLCCKHFKIYFLNQGFYYKNSLEQPITTTLEPPPLFRSACSRGQVQRAKAVPIRQSWTNLMPIETPFWIGCLRLCKFVYDWLIELADWHCTGRLVWNWQIDNWLVKYLSIVRGLAMDCWNRSTIGRLAWNWHIGMIVERLADWPTIDIWSEFRQRVWQIGMK